MRDINYLLFTNLHQLAQLEKACCPQGGEGEPVSRGLKKVNMLRLFSPLSFL